MVRLKPARKCEDIHMNACFKKNESELTKHLALDKNVPADYI